MKVGFFLQRRFAYVGHEIAVLLKERYGISEFCGYTSLRSSFEFLKNQNEITYSALLLDDDIYAKYKNEKLDLNYIARLEREYGQTMWKYIYLDRVIRFNQLLREYPYDTPRYTHDEMLRIVQVAAREIENFLDTEKPDVLFFSIVSNTGSYLLYSMARKRGIKTYILDVARIGNKYFLSDGYEESTFVRDSFERIQRGDIPAGEVRREAENFLKDFQEKNSYYLEKSKAISNPAYTKKANPRLYGLSFLLPSRLWRVFYWLTLSIRNYAAYSDDYVTQNPYFVIIDKVKRKWRTVRGYTDLYDPIDTNEEYAYLPLHTEPEAYPMLLAPYYTDQVWLAKQVARSLPAGFKLYVKDHPTMMGYRTRAYYRELKKIPNVKLIDVNTSSLELIKKSRLVVTLTGTAGWEAALLKKPVVIFGGIFYKYLSSVRLCSDITTLPDIVREQLTSYRYNEQELVDFISALYMESVDIDLVHLWDIEGSSRVKERRQELVPLVDLIASKLNLKKIA